MSGEPTPNQEGPQRQGLSLATLAAHAGLPRKPSLGGQNSAHNKGHTLPQNAHVTPLFQTTVFDFDSVQTAADRVLRQGAYEYGRVGLPNPHELGAAVAALEGADEGVATSTGMGAISAALLSHLCSGDLVIAQYNVYGGTLEFLEHDLPRYGITVLFEDFSNLARVEEILVGAGRIAPAPLKETPNTGPDVDVNSSNREHDVGEKPAGASNQVSSDLGTSREKSALSNNGVGQNGMLSAVSKPPKVVILAETVSNPLLVVTDVRALGALSKRSGAILMVDNTFGTPLRTRPLSEKADLVIHSATKFLGGHHDLLAGVVVGSAKFICPIRRFVQRVGLWAAPFDAWLAVRGIRTLQVRMERAWASAAVLGRQLEEDPRVTNVMWHERVALVTFVVVGGIDAAEVASAALKLIVVATSLGGVTTTISHPATSSHASLSVEQRSKLGISDGHLRISVGLEHAGDLWADLERGLAAAAALNCR